MGLPGSRCTYDDLIPATPHPISEVSPAKKVVNSKTLPNSQRPQTLQGTRPSPGH